jgi:hypothetical protein
MVKMTVRYTMAELVEQMKTNKEISNPEMDFYDVNGKKLEVSYVELRADAKGGIQTPMKPDKMFG